jgi:hypothetical protein
VIDKLNGAMLGNAEHNSLENGPLGLQKSHYS